MLSEADTRVLVALFVRISHAHNARPFMVGWVGDEIRFSIQFSSTRPAESIIAAARLAATIGIDVLVYSFEGVTSKNVDINPRDDPAAKECLMGFAWHQSETVGWYALMSRDDVGGLSYSEPERVTEIPAHINGMVRQALAEPAELGEVSDWLADCQHSLHIYPT